MQINKPTMKKTIIGTLEKTIKANLGEIQKKHKLTEYIALLNAKNHIKNEIINNNVIN